MTNIIILAGAPERKSLDWTDVALSSNLDFQQPFSFPSLTNDSESPHPFAARWREVSTETMLMRPVLSKLNIDARSDNDPDKTPAEFFTPIELLSQTPSSNRDSSNDSYASTRDSEEAASQALSEFYDHSFSIHEAVPSTELTDISEVEPGTPTYETNEDLLSATRGGTGGIIRVPSRRRLSQVPRPRHLTNLEEIPSARHLQSIQPSTMTVNLIVAVLAVSDPKTVVTGARYGKPRETELVELLVGDETKAGFSITMWLPREMHVNWKDNVNATPEGSRSALRRDLKILRPRDIVLLQNVALSSFRGKVHGQSLRRDVTKVILLFRKKVDDEDMAGVYNPGTLRNASDSDQQLLKVKRVRDWMLEFVGERPAGTSRRGGRGIAYPPDTQ